MIRDLFLDCQITGAGAGNVKNESMEVLRPEQQSVSETVMTSHKVVRERMVEAVGGMKVRKI